VEIGLSEIQLQNSPTTSDVQRRPRMNAGSLLTFVCGAFVLFLICLPVLQRNLSAPEVSGLYWESGSAAVRGANPFAPFPGEPTAHLTVMGEQHDVLDLNLNPPCVLPVFQVLSHLSLRRFSLVWTVGSFLLLFCTVALLIWQYPAMQKRKILWLVLWVPVFDTLVGGELYFVLFALAALALVLVERDHELAAAIAIGLLVAIKPTTAFWPLFLFLAGHRRIALRSLWVMLAVSAAPVLFYGLSIYREWFAALGYDPHWIFATNIAIPALFARLGLRPVGFVLAGVLAGALAWTVWKRKPGFTTVSGIALCAAILCAPLAWVSYALIIAPYFVSRRWRLSSYVAAALLVVSSTVPMTMAKAPGWVWMALGSGIYVVAVGIILAGFLSREPELAEGR
jgi:hypothetical protein